MYGEMIKFNGTNIEKTNLKVPGWGGEETNNQFQPWHHNSFMDAACLGATLTYPYNNVIVSDTDCPKPFEKLSDLFYQLKLETSVFSENYLLLLPHYRFYTDRTWSTPLPVACSWNTECWPFPLVVLFRFGPKPAIFNKNEPFAQLVPVKQDKMMQMTERENKIVTEAAKAVDDKYITRRWVTSTGTHQDNLYNVLLNLSQMNSLPFKLTKRRKYKIL